MHRNCFAAGVAALALLGGCGGGEQSNAAATEEAAATPAVGTGGENAAAESSWIVGRWSEGDCTGTDILEFRADGSFNGEGDEGSWRLDGETLTVTMGSEGSEALIVRQAGATAMTMHEPSSPDRIADRLTRC